ncbi:hypothetical protein [Streptomyces sp. NPDC047706]|uniref:hypothetical protein n=1 Tax=Streptomyces sp. NPDC047706 TaxID=3365486 RepID=UPI003722188B
MPGFQIVTDAATYTEGEATSDFKELGYDRAVLESYKEIGDWVELSYGGGLTVSIPEARIRYIAERSA